MKESQCRGKFVSRAKREFTISNIFREGSLRGVKVCARRKVHDVDDFHRIKFVRRRFVTDTSVPSKIFTEE